MPAQSVEDAFMADLFADLDSATFDDLPSSPLTPLAPPPPPPSKPSSSVRNLGPSSSARAREEGVGSASKKSSGIDAGHQLKKVKRAPLPDSFWDPPTRSSAPTASTSTKGQGRAQDGPITTAQGFYGRQSSGSASQSTLKMTATTTSTSASASPRRSNAPPILAPKSINSPNRPRPRPISHLPIQIESHPEPHRSGPAEFEVEKENPIVATRIGRAGGGLKTPKKPIFGKDALKGKDREKGKAIGEEYSDLLEGMDFSEEVVLSPVVDRRAKVRVVEIHDKADAKGKRKAEVGMVVGEERIQHIPNGKDYMRCRVLSIDFGVGEAPKLKPRKILQVEVLRNGGVDYEPSEQVQGDGGIEIGEATKASKEDKLVILEDDWYDTPVRVDNIIHLVPSPSSASSLPPPPPTQTFPIHLSLSHTYSPLLILHPDLLISSTKIADSSHCPRKALLQEIIRTSAGGSGVVGAEGGGGNGAKTESLYWGNSLHELMQGLFSGDTGPKEEGQEDEAGADNQEGGLWGNSSRRCRIEKIVKSSVGDLWEIEGVSRAKALARGDGGDSGRGLSVQGAVEVMMDKSKVFQDFKELFVGDDEGKVNPDAFLTDDRATTSNRARVAIQPTSLDIEEDIWSPKWGLKGKVDVSVLATIVEAGRAPARGQLPFTATGREVEPTTMPFEIKTGRSVAGSEHRAQTMLYTLLMSDRYDETIDTGLLYYTQSNQVVRVQAAKHEIRGLLIARNYLADFLFRRMHLTDGREDWKAVKKEEDARVEVKLESDEDDMEAELGFVAVDDEEAFEEEATIMLEPGDKLLPPPIDDERTCKHCYIKEACMLYRRAVDGDTEIFSDEDDPLQMLFEDQTGHLTEAHTTFFRQWEQLISLEEQEMVRFKKEIWTLGADERMKLGRCMANMCIDETFNVSAPDTTGAKIHSFTYRLQHATRLPTQATSSQRAARSLLGGSISVNDPVVVSLEQPNVLAIARGFVLEMTPHEVVLGLDHSLTNNAQAAQKTASTSKSDLTFRVDKDELAAGLGRVRDNLIQLFVLGGDERRRRLVVDLEPPQFEAVDYHRRLFSPNLNSDQVDAVRKVLSAKDYALVLGMPGTGKTTTIAEILKALAKAGKSVLLTSYTHSAVDNILLKIGDSKLNVLRLGNRDKIMPELHHLTLDPKHKATTLEQFDKQLMTPQIVATTCLSINEPIFTRRRFDVCIVDEASQVTLPTCLGPLRFADSFVLVGDHHQLPPLVRNHAARKGGLDVSLFKRLSEAHPDSIVYLTQQYRMNEDIMLLSNKLIYDDRLQVGSSEVANQRLQLSDSRGLERFHESLKMGADHSSCWIRDLVDPSRTVVFVDTDRLPARERKVGSLIDNVIEAQLVVQLTEALVQCGVQEKDIAVIALYRQQIKVISRQLQHLPQVEVLTADRSQGRDKECILMSLTRSNTEGQVGDLLADWRRINVCLTRAKSKLVVFGSRSTLQQNSVLEQFFSLVREKDWIYVLPSGAHDVHGGEVSSPIAPRHLKRKADNMASMRTGPAQVVTRQPLLRDVVNSQR